jgi:hypothetical protein
LVVSDETKILKDQPMIYPNPGQGIFFIPGLQRGAVVEVWNVQGRLIQTKQISEGRIDIQDCMPGIYLIKYSDRQGKTQIHRVIVR